MMTVRAGMRWVVAVSSMGVWAQAAVGQAPRYQSPYTTPPPSATPALPTPTPISANGSVVEDVVVRVNNQIIDRSDVERAQAQLQQELAQDPGISSQDREDREKNMLRDMIDQQLLLSKAKELGLNADAEVVRRMDEIRKQNHLPDMEALEKAARQQGVNFEDFKANIRNQILTQEVVRDEVGRKLQLSQGQEQAYYDAHKQDFTQPEQERLSEILIPLPADAGAEAVAQAQKKAETVDEQVKAGKSFEELAKQYSGGQTAPNGGDLGLFKRGALAKVLEDDTFGLKAGQSTAPIRTRQGFVILKVTEHQDAGVPPLKQVEPQIQEAMYVQQMQPALRAYLTRLREEAYIDIKPGFVDSGASARQSKPVFTAYQAPQPKKKVVQEKARFDRRGGTTTQAAAAKPAVPALPTGNGPAVVPPTVSGAAPVPGTSALVAKAAAEGNVNAPVATVEGSAKTAKARPVRVTKKGKVKVKREKIRFGQAPRTALPGNGEEVATTQGSDVGAGAASAAVTPGGTMEQGQRGPEQRAANDVAPGVAMAPTESTTQLSASSDADPLAPKVENHGKIRFASRDKEFRAAKEAQKEQRVEEKVAATPQGPGVQEAASRDVQSAPLGLNGNTAAKKKKEKKEKVKGAPKERLQEQRPVETTAAPISPTVNPKLGANPGVPADGSGNQAPDSNEKNTTLPASTAAPGAPPQGQPLPPDGTPATTPNGTPAPQPQP